MTSIERKVIELIHEKGSKQAPICAKAIGTQLRIPEGPATCTQTRKIIQQAIKDGCPIGSTSRGYYWMRDEDEVLEYIASLEGRAAANIIRARNVKKAFYGEEAA